MNSWAFRAALRATARVALGVTAVGCGGSVAAGPDARIDSGVGSLPDAATAMGEATPADDAAVASDVSEASVPVDALACEAPPASELLPEGLHVDAGAAIDRATFDCCVAKIAAFGPPDAAVSIAELPDAGPADPVVTSCCAAIIARLDYEERTNVAGPDASPWWGDQNASGQVHWACCEALNYPEGPSCTPWGPPTPPAMPRRQLEVA